MKLLLSCFCFFLALQISAQEKKYVTVNKAVKLMGSDFNITVVATNEEIGYIHIDIAIAEIMRIEKIISSWDENSETSKINKNAGIRPVKVSPELYKLIARSKQISELTDGAFDISFASMNTVWKFDGSMNTKPSKEEIKKSIQNVGYEKIILNEKDQTVFLNQKGMKISFGAVGKGFAADKAKELLVDKQVPAGVINADGDITTWGTKVTGDKWMIGIANPMSKEKVFSWLPLVESSVATSGNYEKFISWDGTKYSHLIDPRTGYPVSGLNSVSVFAKCAELSDALATAVFVLGKDAGISLIEQLGGIEVIVIDSESKIHKSEGIFFETEQ